MKELSSRGLKATKPSLSYIKLFAEALGNQYDAEDNPEGIVCLTVAENKLSYKDLLRPKLLEIHHGVTASMIDEFEPFYGDMKGKAAFKKSIAKYMMNHFVNKKHSESFKIDPEKLVCSTGCGFLLSMMGWCLGESGDACIVPAPYYPAFDNDLNVLSNVTTVPAFMKQENNKWVLTRDCLERAYKEALLNGHKPAVILITNPNNPTGTNYSREELKLVLEWSREKGIFIISDEIYANSSHTFYQNNMDVHFTSMFDIALSESESDDKSFIGDDLFVLYGFSKDFCLSGMRAGVVYTENSLFHQALNNLSYFGSISSDTQCILNALISDSEWVSRFHQENNNLLSKSCQLLMELLDSIDIPYFPATSGLFLVLDLRKYLKAPTWEAERELFDKLVTEGKIIMTPGKIVDRAFEMFSSTS